MASTKYFRQEAQYPLNGVGNKAEHAFVGVEKVFFTGLTGNVGTAYGIPDVTVTRQGTGVYNVTYPRSVACDIIPGIQAPTGQAYDITITDNQPTSGTAQFQITRTVTFQGSGAGSSYSGTVVNYAPGSGTVANLLFFVSPITKF